MGGKSSRELKKPDYEQGKVYLFCVPTARSCISASPFALKLETWLRLKKIPHEVLRRADYISQKGQIPFIEYNGKEYNESNLIISFLTKEFDVEDQGISEEEKGIGLCVARSVDNQLAQSYIYYRYTERPYEFLSLLEFLPSWRIKLFSRLAPRMIRGRYEKHGIGLNSPAEVYNLGCADIKAIADLLGEKPFLFGDSITTFDCYVFGHLAQIFYLPIDYPHKQYIQENHSPQLDEYMERIKNEIWPDWEELCAMNLQSTLVK